MPDATQSGIGLVGVGSWTFPWALGSIQGYPPTPKLSLLGLAEVAHRLGAEVVQVVDNLPLDAVATAELAEFSAALREFRLTLEVGTRGVQPDRLQRYLDLALAAGAKLVRSMFGWPGTSPAVAEVRLHLREALPLFERAGVTLALENYEVYSAATLAEIVAEAASPALGICYDPVNSLGALESPAEVLELVATATVNVHAKDVIVRRAPHLMGFSFEGCVAGSGQIDFRGLRDRLARENRRPNYIVELWTPFQGTLANTLQTEMSWARQSVDYLKTLRS